jgi:hypothetical protein
MERPISKREGRDLVSVLKGYDSRCFTARPTGESAMDPELWEGVGESSLFAAELLKDYFDKVDDNKFRELDHDIVRGRFKEMAPLRYALEGNEAFLNIKRIADADSEDAVEKLLSAIARAGFVRSREWRNLSKQMRSNVAREREITAYNTNIIEGYMDRSLELRQEIIVAVGMLGLVEDSPQIRSELGGVLTEIVRELSKAIGE